MLTVASVIGMPINQPGTLRTSRVAVAEHG
jgi:hypothetical protein